MDPVPGDLEVGPSGRFVFRGTVPGDKAIAHRAAFLLALSRRGGLIRGYPEAGDAASTLRVLAALGAGVAREAGGVRLQGGGWEALKAPAAPLDCGNSGSTLRMAAGVLAACAFEAVFTGDASLRRRPMDRVANPLSAMGAVATCEGEGGRLPLRIRGGRLRGVAHRGGPPSAQVKTAVLLAGLAAEGRTSWEETLPTRDHTERLLAFLGVRVEASAGGVAVGGGQRWEGRDLDLPGDPSTAAFPLVRAACGEGEARVDGMGLNPRRLGFVRALERMGADVAVMPSGVSCGEPVGTVRVRGGRPLRGIRIGPDEVPDLIDELPVLALAGACAEGETRVEGASELRLKESDRIAALVAGLSRLGVRITALPDGFRILGGGALEGAEVDAAGDHRIAMTLALAGTLARGRTRVVGAGWAAVSFPGFPALLGAG